jgi:hypothetical protein
MSIWRPSRGEKFIRRIVIQGASFPRLGDTDTWTDWLLADEAALIGSSDAVDGLLVRLAHERKGAQHAIDQVHRLLPKPKPMTEEELAKAAERYRKDIANGAIDDHKNTPCCDHDFMRVSSANWPSRTCLICGLRADESDFHLPAPEVH